MPAFVKCAAICAPITPAPRTAALRTGKVDWGMKKMRPREAAVQHCRGRLLVPAAMTGQKVYVVCSESIQTLASNDPLTSALLAVLPWFWLNDGLSAKM